MKTSQFELRDNKLNLISINSSLKKVKKSSKSPKVYELDYSKVKNYWNSVKSTILGPYIMEGFGFPDRAGRIRFIEECKIVEIYTRSINSSSSVLDLGSGIGNWTEYFAKHFNSVVSVESSNVLHQVLQNRFLNSSKVKTINTDVLSFKSNKKFGIIFLGGLLMYLNQNETVSLLKNIDSWLESEGIIICRESTIRKGMLIKNVNYQVIYRSVNHYKSIFDKCELIFVAEELNKGYISVQMSCEVMKRGKKLIPERYWNLRVMGFILYWIFRLGYPQNIKFWNSSLEKIGIEFPILLNHFFVLKPKQRQVKS